MHKAKYQLSISKRERTGLKYLNDWKAFIKYSNDIDDIYKDIKEYNPNKKQKILIVLDDMIADMLSNKKRNPMVTELFIRLIIYYTKKTKDFSCFLSHSLISLFQKIIQQTILLWIFQTNEA